jgi:hypothetical protein
MIDKSRYWQAVCWLENMVDGWQDSIGDLLQLPYAYCIHDMDTDSKSDHRKDHVHIILVFPNTTTYKHALDVFSQLNSPCAVCVNTCQACIGMRHCYDYLIHDTDDCRSKGKYQYAASCRVEGNCFDIGLYEQLSIVDKQDRLKELLLMIRLKQLYNNEDFISVLLSDYDSSYFDVYLSYSGVVQKMLDGVYQKMCRKNTLADAEKLVDYALRKSNFGGDTVDP